MTELKMVKVEIVGYKGEHTGRAKLAAHDAQIDAKDGGSSPETGPTHPRDCRCIGCVELRILRHAQNGYYRGHNGYVREWK